MNHFYTKLGLLLAIVGSLYLIASLGNSEFSNMKKKHGAHWWVNRDPNAFIKADYYCTIECEKQGGVICGTSMAKCCRSLNGCRQTEAFPPGYYAGSCPGQQMVVNVKIPNDSRTFYCSD